jgi:orotate phosphoribosyltransferase
VVTELGAQVVAFGAILSRAEEDHPFSAALVTLMALDLPTYAPDACPQCAAGQAAVKPGSRPSTG